MLQKIPEADAATLRASLGDIVALSTLTAVWSGARPVRIAESLASALYTMLGARFIHVALNDPRGGPLASIARTGHHPASQGLAETMGPELLAWARSRDPHDLMPRTLPGKNIPLRITCRQIGHDAELGVIAAGFAGDDGPTPLHHLLLDISATQATTGLNNALLVESLRHREEQLRLASDFGKVGFWDVNHTDGTMFWDPRCRAMFGIFDENPLTLDDFYRGLHPDDMAHTTAAYSAALDPDQRAFYDVEYRTIGRDDGFERWISARGRGVFDSEGNCHRSLGTTVDITDRKRAEEQLRLATDAGEVGFWDLDHTAKTAFWDLRCRALFGVSAAYPVDQTTFYSGLHPDDRDRAAAVYTASIDPDIRADYNVEYRTVGIEDGRIRWVHAKGRTFFSDDGRCLRSVGTLIDITVRKDAENALREINENLEAKIAEALESRRFLAHIVETTDAFIQVVDLDYNWLAINRASADEFERIYGVPARVGDNMLHALDGLPDHQTAVRDVWARALAGEDFTEISEYGDVNRDRRAYEMKFNALRDADGTVIGAYQFVYDVTDRLADQARLMQAEEHLRQSQKMEAVGQLTGGIAHDFNNMLAVVMGSIELLDRRVGASDPRAKRLLDNAAEGARRAANLTQRLLAFSRQQPLRPERSDVNRLVSGISDLLRHSLGGEVRLETALAADLWPVHVDTNQLENVLLNLGVNARDAMDGVGRLTLETRNAELEADDLKTHPDVPPGPYVMISVTDTGSGMSAEVMEKAFEPFFTTKAVGKGTGLGLSQVYGFIKQSGGHVAIQSEIGAGTTVRLYLPKDASAGEDMVATPEAAPIELAGPEEVILVVDDEPTVRQFSVEVLIELGYRVIEADGAAQALTLLGRHPEIRLLFTDLAMPDKNGRQLVEEARGARPDLKVLYTTGYAGKGVQGPGEIDPSAELIGKPFTMDELAARVRAVLDA